MAFKISFKQLNEENIHLSFLKEKKKENQKKIKATLEQDGITWKINMIKLPWFFSSIIPNKHK